MSSSRYLIPFLLIPVIAANAGENGSEPPREGLLLKAMTKHTLPKMKADVANDRPVFETGRECFTAAQSVDDANACNEKVRKVVEQQNMDDFEVDDFDTWNEDVRKEVLGEINGMLTFFDCIDAARNVTEASECEEPD